MESRKSIPSTEKFRNRFVDDYKAINPLEMEDEVDFGVEMELTIQRRCDKEKKSRDESLKTDVLTDYFLVSEKDIENFEEDLFMPIVDNSYFVA